MVTEVSNIDDLLLAGNTPSIPPTSESKEIDYIQNDVPENDLDIPDKKLEDDFYSTPEERFNEDETSEEKESQEEKKEQDMLFGIHKACATSRNCFLIITSLLS